MGCLSVSYFLKNRIYNLRSPRHRSSFKYSHTLYFGKSRAQNLCVMHASFEIPFWPCSRYEHFNGMKPDRITRYGADWLDSTDVKFFDEISQKRSQGDGSCDSCEKWLRNRVVRWPKIRSNPEIDVCVGSQQLSYHLFGIARNNGSGAWCVAHVSAWRHCGTRMCLLHVPFMRFGK